MIHCKKCGDQIDISFALESSPFSWPELQTIWYVCKKCKEGNHIRFISGEIQLIEIISAPGPDWKTIQSQSDPSVSIRIDPGYLHVWLKNKHYEVIARE
jgi:hypothetical protein